MLSAVRATMTTVAATAAGLLVCLGLFPAEAVGLNISAAEDSGSVKLNETGTGFLLSAHTGGTPQRRTRPDECSSYRPVLAHELVNVMHETTTPRPGIEALVTLDSGDDKKMLVRRTCQHSDESDSKSDRGVSITVSHQSRWVSLKQVSGTLARSAFGLALFPRTRAQYSPPARIRTLVGVDTWFWVPATSWKPITKVVAVLPVVVTATAVPTALQFVPGDGSAPVTCPGPGLPWIPGGRSPCSHVYQWASTGRANRRYNGVTSIIWFVYWSSSTGASGVIGPIPLPQRASIKVAEAEVMLRI